MDWGAKMKKYTVLIVDLKQSRLYSIEDRTSIQNYIIEVIGSLNIVFAGEMIRDLEFSAGDELQGLFESPEGAYLYLRLLNMLLFPVEIRAGIGMGEWDVKIEKASTTVQDGSAYHNARCAIDEVKNTVGNSALFYSGSTNDIFVNAAMETAFMMTERHSEYQNELMLLSELLYPIDAGGKIHSLKIYHIFDLVMKKENLNYYAHTKKKKSVKKYPLKEIEYREIKRDVIDALEDDSTFYVKSGRRRGLPVQLSELLGVSRQSMEKNLKSANIYMARNSTIVLLKLMNTYFQKGEK